MIKWVIKWLLRIAVVGVVLVILLLAFKDSIWTALAEHRIRSQTGMEVRIGRFSSGILSPVVTIENLKLYNTAEFGGTLFLDIPELHMEFDPIALAQRRLRMKLVRFNLGEISIVRNEAGQTNVMAFIEKQKPGGSKKEKDAAQRLLGDLEFDGIDVLNLSMGKARFIDLHDSKANREIAVGMENQIFKDVNSEGDAYAILFMIWLRSGGKFSVTPNNLARDYFERKVGEIEKTVRQRAESPRPPAAAP
jgi:uncharacterized protein involved in outer membrane biogenesis